MRSGRRQWRTSIILAIACLAAVILSCGNTGMIARAAGPVVLVDLSGPAVVADWVTVNDPVMGGRSSSAISFDGGMVFSGDISLENNGGFASARGPSDPAIGLKATGATSLRVRALGDGKTYLLKVETGQPWSYVERFSTQAGMRRIYDLPIGGFQPAGRFLDPLANVPPLDPSAISRVALYILDKQEGPFRLVVSGIDVVS